MPTPGDILDALDREVRRSLGFWRRLTASQLFVGSFLALVLFGTLLLWGLPGVTRPGNELSLVDALFTATSAVCVTGLIVVDTATFFTPFGQGVILFLIQLGGLGIIAFTTAIILLLGGRMTLRAEAAAGASETLPRIDPGRLLVAVLRYTFLIEAAGAAALWITWAAPMGVAEALWPAVFHAISAFCNAGFSVFSENLVPFAGDPATLTIVMALVVLGGIGFLVLEELRARLGRRERLRLSLHTRLVVVTTAALILVGAALLAAFEWNNFLATVPWYARPFEALFLSVTPRTAGFNTVDYAELTSATLFLTMLLMFVGGSPGSTAGGVKTTTVAILWALAIARLRGRTVAGAFRRSIPEGTVQRAVGLVVAAGALLTAAILLLQATELGGVPHPHASGRFLELAFEAVSAFDTVGLSTGVTPTLSPAGKIVVIVLMFVGRVGPLTLAAAMVTAAERRGPRFRYATEDVVVG